jgi:uncharacterized protein
MSSGLPFARRPDGVRLSVRLVPKAANERIIGIVADETRGTSALKVSVHEPPEGGKANEALLRLLARALDLPRRDLTLAQGAADRRKLVYIAGDPAALESLIAKALDPWLAPA